MSARRVKQVIVKVVIPGRKTVRRTYVAGTGKIFTKEGIELTVNRAAAHLDKHGLGEYLKMVQIGPAEFNFVPRAPEPVSGAPVGKVKG